jgi:hypothetical protein
MEVKIGWAKRGGDSYGSNHQADAGQGHQAHDDKSSAPFVPREIDLDFAIDMRRLEHSLELCHRRRERRKVSEKGREKGE